METKSSIPVKQRTKGWEILKYLKQFETESHNRISILTFQSQFGLFPNVFVVVPAYFSISTALYLLAFQFHWEKKFPFAWHLSQTVSSVRNGFFPIDFYCFKREPVQVKRPFPAGVWLDSFSPGISPHKILPVWHGTPNQILFPLNNCPLF